LRNTKSPPFGGLLFAIIGKKGIEMHFHARNHAGTGKKQDE
jgi:hypothetical protein